MKHASSLHRRAIPLSRRILAGTIAGLCAFAAHTSSAEENVWNDLAASVNPAVGPYWTNPPSPYDGNWSLGRLPLASDDVLFQLPFVPPAFNFGAVSSTLSGLDTGRVVVVFDDPIVLPPALVANSLNFKADYTLE